MQITVKGEFTLSELLVSLQRAVDALEQRGDVAKVARLNLYFTAQDAEGKEIAGPAPRARKGQPQPRPEHIKIEIVGYNGPTAADADSAIPPRTL